MADLKIPNLNMKSDKYIFKKKLGLRRKSRKILFIESSLMFLLSLLLVFINYLIPEKNLLLSNLPKNIKLRFYSKVRFFNFIMPPFIAISSLIIFSFSLIYFYNPVEIEEKKELINPK